MALFADVDRALVVASLAERLRGAGLVVPLAATVRATAALDAVGPLSLGDLYWATRVSFVSSPAEGAIFDRVFDAVFDTDHRLRDPDRGQRRLPGHETSSTGDHHHRVRATVDTEPIDGAGLPWATRPPMVADDPDDGDDGSEDDDEPLTIPDLRPAAAEVDAERPFDQLDDDELTRLGQAIEQSVTRWPRRRSRRRRVGAGGDRPHLRAALRHARRTGGDPITIPASSPKLRARPVTVVVDVSGSMETFARAYLHVARALTMNPQVQAEVFAFATDLTRITASLRHRSPVEAIERASTEVGDRFGGTRVATSLATLVRHRWWRGLVRGAVVIIVSDGWDTDPPAELARHLGRLQRLAHRIVWVNPRLAADGYEPLVAGMAAALPYCDDFCPGNTLSSMEEVLVAMAGEAGPGLRARRRGGGAGARRPASPPGPTRGRHR